jgi:hypothetical protein
MTNPQLLSRAHLHLLFREHLHLLSREHLQLLTKAKKLNNKLIYFINCKKLLSKKMTKYKN